MPDLFEIIAWAIAALVLVAGANALGAGGLLLALVLVVFAVGVASVLTVERARRQRLRPEARFRPTPEVRIDPVNGRRTRVYVDPATGERREREEI